MLSLCECTFAFKSGEVEGLKRINRVHVNLFRNKFSLSLVFENYARSRGRRTRWKNSCGCLQIDLLVLVVTRFLSRHGSLSLSLFASLFSHTIRVSRFKSYHHPFVRKKILTRFEPNRVNVYCY